MNKTILVPLDGSPMSETVLPHALAIAAAMSDRLRIMQSVVMPVAAQPVGWPLGPVSVPNDLWSQELAGADTYLKNKLQQLAASGIRIETKIRTGDPGEEILASTIGDDNISMIAMSTHGRSGISRLVFGSVAEKVLHSAPCPLLLVRGTAGAPTQTVTYRKILVPLDGSAFAAQALAHAEALAWATGAELLLTAVIASEPDPALGEAGLMPYWMIDEGTGASDLLGGALSGMAYTLKERGLHVSTRLAYGQPATELLNIAQQESADLIVMASHGRSGLPRMWLGSVALSVVQHSSIPVLLIRPQE